MELSDFISTVACVERELEIREEYFMYLFILFIGTRNSKEVLESENSVVGKPHFSIVLSL